MKKAILFDIAKFIALFGIAWLTFSYFSSQVDSEINTTLSISNEEKLAKVLVNDLLLNDSSIKLETNTIADSAVQVISKRLIKNIGLTDYQYKIRVIKSDEINAFTMPGGNIFIYTGLLKFAKTPEEVAAVLAHEIGHAEKKHVVKKLIKELGISLMFSAVSGGDAIVLNEITRTATSTAFDREQEKEADDYGLNLMVRSKLNPKSLATMFRKIDEKSGDSDNNMELLNTHPNNNSRIKNSLEYKTKPNFKQEKINLNWQKVLDSLNN